MNQTNHYFIRGLWIFAFLTVGMLVLLYAAQAGFAILLFVGMIICVILSLGLLLLLLQANKALEENQQEVLRLRLRIKALMQREHKTDENLQQEEFNIDEALARVMHAIGSDFDNLTAYIEKVLQNIAREMDIVQGLVFVLNDADQLFHISGEYAYYSEEKPHSFALGENLPGQVAKNRKLLNIKDLPDDYITILSGLGKSSPRHLIIAPFVRKGKSIGVMELSSFKPFGENDELLIRRVCETMAELLNELRG